MRRKLLLRFAAALAFAGAPRAQILPLDYSSVPVLAHSLALMRALRHANRSDQSAANTPVSFTCNPCLPGNRRHGARPGRQYRDQVNVWGYLR